MTERDTTAGAAITVRDALRIPALVQGRPHVVAGRKGLEHQIRWAHAGELTDIAAMLSGGELLLTTGLGIGPTAAAQRRFIEALARRSIAGIVLELGRSYTKAPAALTDAADVHSIPLIVTRREVRFVEITEAIHRAIIGRQLELLRRGEEIHRRFTELLLEGAGVREVLDVLAGAIGNPVLLEHEGDVLAYASPGSDPVDALAGWETANSIVLPVPSAHGKNWGTLIVPPFESPLDDAARIAAERAVGVLAVVLLRHREEELPVLGEQGRFLTAVAAGDISPRAAQLEADALGFDHDGEWLLPLALGAHSSARASAPAWTAFCQTLRRELDSRRIAALLGIAEETADGADGLLVVGLTGSDKRTATIEQVAQAARAAAAQHLGSPDGVVIAAGRQTSGWGEVGELLLGAAATVALAQSEEPRPWHEASAPDLRHLVWRLRETDTVQLFAKERLASVLEHDRLREAAPLLPTLQALSAHGWNKAEAARALHLQRQSIYPRLRRLERLLATDLADPREQGALDVALLVYRLHSLRRPSN
jgi:purine catabolism regulator